MPTPDPAADPTAKPTDQNEIRLHACLERLARGEPEARDELIAIACDRMRGLAHRMLRTFPTVRRWDETEDVVQNAAMRLYRALGDTVPRDARGFSGLASLQIRRELLDLAKKYAGPESFAANQETNCRFRDGAYRAKIDDAQDRTESSDQLERWTRLHEAAATLPEEERELFHLVWYLGMQQEAVSTLLGCSVRTIKRRWESAKSLLADAVSGNPLT
jgi:RNA polymerase sigma-70 factor (ECF subfamily)